MDAARQIIEDAGLSVDEVIMAGLSYQGTDGGDILDFCTAIVEAGNARPFSSSVALASATVRQWHTIRGRLIDKGITDPLRQLSSLQTLLDVVEVMILDSMSEEKEREEYLRGAWRKSTIDDADTPPPGWTGDGAEGFDI